MLDKLDQYDTLGIVVPGVLLAYLVPICFPRSIEVVSMTGFPEAIDLLGFAAIAIVLGQVVQAAGSGLEKLLYLTWGGTPSDKALSLGLGDRYLSRAEGQRIRQALLLADDGKADNQTLFRLAMAQANSAAGSRTHQFNALYAYYRGLVVVFTLGLLFLIASRFWGAAADWSAGEFLTSICGATVLLLLMWYRGKQRAYYFVREVLLVAERNITTIEEGKK